MVRKNSSNSTQKSKNKLAESKVPNANALDVNASKKKDPEPNESEAKVPEKKYAWTQNVKYRGKRYRANRPANILPEDIESLLEAKVIKVVN